MFIEFAKTCLVVLLCNLSYAVLPLFLTTLVYLGDKAEGDSIIFYMSAKRKKERYWRLFLSFMGLELGVIVGIGFAITDYGELQIFGFVLALIAIVLAFAVLHRELDLEGDNHEV